MTPSEFKAWFEGFTEAMDNHPTPAQWAKVKERVAQIDGKETTYPVFVDRYWPARRYWEYPAWTYLSTGANGGTLRSDQITQTLSCAGVSGDSEVGKIAFSVPQAMHHLGRADYEQCSPSSSTSSQS